MKTEDYLYETLPYLYTAGGVLTLLLSAEGIGRASGVLLISAALLVFHMRIDYRTRRAREAESNLNATQMKLKFASADKEY